ncbi:TetR/AcrR family transcriptional regulator [Gimesia panareensis]|uniref:HTH-type transcriptional repressor NicS n=1 Tax=Gimesia panareensis TaxID=2527978 RepID=A0A518A2J5_9PLAN|nr:TetR/AcrR family transcriptional regulator [Gimesia panareensis]QDT26011.1 HTH-type transcriptional repressor NicS [Gimesia panareensis]QDU48947.1 HTH-type transcriptional repressor NicS [Gimesia panareensis]QDV17887.1 HTH-type transcriptional repressor NicS [Gimesia panareensis]
MSSTDTPKKEVTSQEAILKAAIEEFAERGVDGARIEAVAREANFNKSLIYRYFNDKRGLFEAALQNKLQERSDTVEKIPVNISEILQYYFEENLRDQNYVRVLLNEAQQNNGAPIIDEPWRREYYQNHINRLKKSQEEGIISDDFDPVCLMLICTALVFFPATLPQLAQLISGHPVDSEEFQAQWKDCISLLGQLLQPGK